MEAWWMSFSFWLRIYQFLISLHIWLHPLALINLHNKCVQASFTSICVCYLVRCLIVVHLSWIESWQHPQISECAAWHQRSAKPCSGRKVWLQHVDWESWVGMTHCLPEDSFGLYAWWTCHWKLTQRPYLGLHKRRKDYETEERLGQFIGRTGPSPCQHSHGAFLATCYRVKWAFFTDLTSLSSYCCNFQACTRTVPGPMMHHEQVRERHTHPFVLGSSLVLCGSMFQLVHERTCRSGKLNRELIPL